LTEYIGKPVQQLPEDLFKMAKDWLSSNRAEAHIDHYRVSGVKRSRWKQRDGNGEDVIEPALIYSSTPTL
jgi:hypothetical protein